MRMHICVYVVVIHDHKPHIPSMPGLAIYEYICIYLHILTMQPFEPISLNT